MYGKKYGGVSIVFLASCCLRLVLLAIFFAPSLLLFLSPSPPLRLLRTFALDPLVFFDRFPSSFDGGDQNVALFGETPRPEDHVG